MRLIDASHYTVNTNISKYVVLDGGDLKAYAIIGVASDLDIVVLAMNIVSEMARTARHYNIVLILATQYRKDLVRGQGRALKR